MRSAEAAAGETMSKKPKIKHEYHAGKDELKIRVHGYALESKKRRDEIIKTLCDKLERSPDRLIKEAKANAKKGTTGKNFRGSQKDVKLVEVGD
jgi:hypothetical protein